MGLGDEGWESVEIDELSSPLPVDGVEVDIRATFAGAGLFVSKNNLNPSVRFFDDRVEIKVMKMTTVRYEDLQSVDVKTGWLTNNIGLTARGSKRAVTANLRSADDVPGVLRFLEARGAPLSKRAREHLAG